MITGHQIYQAIQSKSSMIFLCLVVFVCPATATTTSKSPFDAAEAALEKKVLADSPDALLEKVAQIKTVNLWLPLESLSDEQKLYIAIQWLKKRRFAEATLLLEDIHFDDPPESATSEAMGTDTDGMDAGAEKSDATTALWRFYYATALIELGRVADAKYQIAELNKSYKGEWEVELLKANWLAQRGDFAGAIAVMDGIVSAKRKEGRAYFHRAMLRLLAQAYDKAYADFMQASKLLTKSHPDLCQQALFQAGLIRLRIHNDRQGAEILFKKGMVLDPDSPLVEDLKGVVK